ncbi:FtsX-like permease family protein [candidate division KSB1 bacterium]|nr:FtsX-like permease family protein [candidate division KSB1 bacterium]
MNFWIFTKKSLFFYRRTHLGVVLGVAVSTAVLVGALVIGDSIRFSLRRLVFDRLGRTEFAMQTGDRFFRTQLADQLSQRLKRQTAPLLQTRGIALAGSGDARVNQVQVLGVDKRFGIIGGSEDVYTNIKPNEVLINQRLAQKLGVEVGENILLRLEKLHAMPKDAPLATDSDISVSQRCTIKAIVTGEQFGRFNLKSSQIEPYSAFISLSFLGEMLDLRDKANILLVAERPGESIVLPELDKELAQVFTPTDAGLLLKQAANGSYIEVRSERIFLEPSIVLPLQNHFLSAQPIFTYFVNQLRLGSKSTPYSFVASSETLPDSNLQQDEIIINRWLADDLGALESDKLELTYFTLGPMRNLIEDTATFHIKKIVPIHGPYADRDLMPDFPGLSEEENCRDWDAGFPIHYDKIRDKDEAYWDEYRGTPKAFICLTTAQQLWGNRFGNLTALRLPNVNAAYLERDLAALLDPASLGYIFQPVRDQGLKAGQESVDFAQLFIGLSFFLIIAALLLTSLLFVFGVEQRIQESGLLLALGFRSKTVQRMMLVEGLVLAIIGSLLGILLGLVYHEIILFALKTIWTDIVGTSALHLRIKPMTILIGMTAGIVMSVLSIWLIARRHAQHTIADLQKGAVRMDVIPDKKPVLSFLVGTLSVVAVLFILLTVNVGSSTAASSAFFAAGALLLLAGLACANIMLARLRRKAHVPLTIRSIGRRNNARRRLRSLTVIGVLASGVFLTFTVGANRTSPLQNAMERSSGTGGFVLWGETALPILYDLNSERGQDFYGFDKGEASFVQFKVKEGDDASCLNLNRISNPQLISVQPDELDERKAFSFAATTEDVDPEHPWKSLAQTYENNVIPGLADQTIIVWGLGKTVGDTLAYRAENGEEFYIRLVGGLANSIFQGNVIIAEDKFIEKYPSVGGYRLLLVDAPFSQQDQLSQKLSWTFQDQGLDLTSTVERLAAFNKVTNTYLSIFMILGGLGLILGSLGIGIVLLRNVMERRGELAVLRAVGFDMSALQKLVLSEHMILLLSGIFIGVLSSLFAILPSLSTPGTRIPYTAINITLMAIIGSGIIWTWLSARSAMQGELLSALRNE